MIKAIADRSSGYELKLLRKFFLRDRTSIIYSAGRRSRKPNWDWDLYRGLIGFIDGLQAVEDLAKKRKLKVTTALREAMEVARLAASMSPNGDNALVASLAAERERIITSELAKLAAARNRVLKGTEDEAVDRGEQIVRRFFEIKKEEKATFDQLEERSGIPKKTMWTWAKGRQPLLSNFIACVQALGYDVVIKERET